MTEWLKQVVNNNNRKEKQLHKYKITHALTLTNCSSKNMS